MDFVYIRQNLLIALYILSFPPERTVGDPDGKTDNRFILERTYAGYKGGLNLAEDFMNKFAGPLGGVGDYFPLPHKDLFMSSITDTMWILVIP
ncbi:MAG: hypothetical protein ABSE13_09690 [Methanoregula sp.]